ncbi:hypothetical protein D3C87_954950 [compost metagenome]
MPKVYVVNKRHHDFSSAEKYGELVYMTEGIVPIFKTTALMEDFEEKLKDFNYKEDFLLISGPSIANMMAAMVLVQGSYSPFTVLIHDVKEQKYVARTMLTGNC